MVQKRWQRCGPKCGDVPFAVQKVLRHVSGYVLGWLSISIEVPALKEIARSPPFRCVPQTPNVEGSGDQYDCEEYVADHRDGVAVHSRD